MADDQTPSTRDGDCYFGPRSKPWLTENGGKNWWFMWLIDRLMDRRCATGDLQMFSFLSFFSFNIVFSITEELQRYIT